MKEITLIWNEKTKFLERAINGNYFNSEYFLWLDAGYFREKNISKYLNNWPSIKKSKLDPRVILIQIRKIEIEEYEKLINFDNNTHQQFQNNFSIAGNAFGGRVDYLIKLIKYYEEVFKLFMEKGQFIGSDQNFYSIISYFFSFF